MSVNEIQITLTLDEARALLPWKGADHSVVSSEWNRRCDQAEDAHTKIRAELRKASREQPDEQGGLL